MIDLIVTAKWEPAFMRKGPNVIRFWRQRGADAPKPTHHANMLDQPEPNSWIWMMRYMHGAHRAETDAR